ncbi:MAG: hypothetical protein IKT56_00855 [Clostridia bacterium]|nr:hypothetical protein [Clostridia bacterium]
MKKRAEKTFGAFQTVTIILLFLATICMVLVYFNNLKIKNENVESNSFNAGLKLYSDSDLGYDTIVKEALLPSDIAVKKSGDSMFAIRTGEDYIKEVYALLDENIICLLGETCKGDIVANPNIFNDALYGEDFIYINYHSPLPSSLLYLHASGEEFSSKTITTLSQSTSNSISEIIIFPKNNQKNSVYGMSRSHTGEVTQYTVINDTKQNLALTEDFDIYKDPSASVMYNADFFGTQGNGSILSSNILYNSSFSYNKISVSKGAKGLSKNKEIQADIAIMLGINPDKAGNYYDQEIGGTVYMSTHGTLKVCDDKILYSNENDATGGVNISDFLGESSKEKHSLYECLSVAESFVKKLSTIAEDEEFLGGDAIPFISALYRESEMLVLEYSYFYENISIYGSEVAIRIKFTPEKLMGLEIYPLTVKVLSNERQKCYQPEWVSNIISSQSEKRNFFKLVFAYIPSNESSTIFEAEWTPVSVN